MIEGFLKSEIEDYKLLDNEYFLKLKDGPELKCNVDGEFDRVEGERNLDNAVILNVETVLTGRKILRDLTVVDYGDVCIKTNRGICALKFSRERKLSCNGNKEQKPLEANWSIN